MLFSEIKLIVFDLDSTLAESKSPLTSSMMETLHKLLSVKKVAVISGGTFTQFERQFLSGFTGDEYFENLYLMPVSGARLCAYIEKKWSTVYSNDFTPEEKDKIKSAFSEVFLSISYSVPEKVYGEIIEDRGAQITFSALGQDAPLAEKSTWDPDHKKREEIVTELKKMIPEFNIQIGGTTSIDITAFGVDKESGINNIQKYLNLSDEEVIFVGDSIFPGGNDYPATKTGVECIKVKNPSDTEQLIKSWL